MDGSGDDRTPARGGLVYVIGASGAGKDTLIEWTRNRLAEENPAAPLAFAHRYMVGSGRPATALHVPLGHQEFAAREAAGLFALVWESLGLRYAVGAEIDLWRAAGLTVVVNGSRAYLPVVAQRYPDVRPVLISTAPEVLRRRLEARGRESAAEIEQRLQRAAEIQVEHPALARVDNSGPLEAGGARLMALLKAVALIGHGGPVSARYL
ncbi:phosphonate metabolism protein/1,5-bisphosphokinase (PRPP-forming) PhnN [Roseospira navarrensis]|uniref:Ribose 1,5-bisphosphate phosphokinase PhnN n=2 Tax=Roseospira navarrensis TaxID=140058 RepID=A0A7X1ZGN6_9PROT|nr:phosphonate metabolism protein/1,5-bisphosphokinase (PRPP-forming) PhnN [Roseospira navarrensis]